MTHETKPTAQAELGWITVETSHGDLVIDLPVHRDGRWECMNFDTEAGHSCAHCGARYHHHEPVEHEETCPHAEPA